MSSSPAGTPRSSNFAAPDTSNSSTSSTSSETILLSQYSPQTTFNGTPSDIYVQVLVNRLKNKLPCNSGESLVRLESDNATQPVVDALVSLAHESLDVIGFALAELLERLIKQLDSHSVATIEVLQSQLFLLKVLSVVMATRSQPSIRPSSRASTIRPADDRSTIGSTINSSAPISWSESPLLDEAVARYLLRVVILCLWQTDVSELPFISPLSQYGDVSFRDFDTGTISSKATVSAYIHEAATFSVYGERSRPPSLAASAKETIKSYVLLSSNDSVYEKTPSFYIDSAQTLMRQIRKYAGRIIFYISASNWEIVIQRLQSKIPILVSQFDELPYLNDLSALEYSVLDRARLSQILNELSSLLVSMSERGHRAIAGPLRSAIWNWVRHFPDEFNELVNSRGGKMDRASGIFDFFYSKCLGAEHVIWPALSILKCIIPERMSDLHATRSRRTNQKLAKFTADLMRYSHHPSKLVSLSLACLTDICRAAIYIKPVDDVPLLLLANDIAQEFESHVWSLAGRSSWNYGDEIDVALWAEVLVSVYRFLPGECPYKLFLACLRPECSDAVKLCAVRACLTLIQEATQFPWQKPLDELEKEVAPHLRQSFKMCVNREKSTPRPWIKRFLVDPLSDRELLLLGMFSIWQARRSFFFSEIPESDFDLWSNLPMKIFRSLLDIAVKISAASTIIRELESAFQLDLSNPSNKLSVRWVKNSLYQMLSTAAIALFDTRTHIETQRVFTGVILRLLEFFARKTYDPILEQIQRDSARVAPMILAEIALLVSLPSADSEVSHTAAKGLRLVAHIESQSDAPPNPTVTEVEKSKRYSVYDRLGDPKLLVVGRVAHQKRARKLLRPMPYCSAVNIAVWQETYARFTKLTESILNVDDDVTFTRARSETYQKYVYQWQNLALFLAVTANASVQDGHETTLLSSVIPSRILPDSMRAMQNPVPLISTFINDLTALLIFEDVQIRDAAREALGVDLNARLHPKILEFFNEVVQAVNFGTADNNEETKHENMLLFVDQYIAVLKLMVEDGHGSSEEVSNMKITPTLLGLATFITRFESPESFRIKQKFCLLCDCVCAETGIVGAYDDSDIRRDLLDTIVEWIVQPEMVTENPNDVYELNTSCLRTIVNLLDRLQLLPSVGTNTRDDSLHFVSRFVIKYSNVLLNAPRSCQPDFTSPDSVSDASSIQRRVRASQRNTELRKLVITGLAHLIRANPESGFKHCLSLAYEEDSGKRVIFSRAFARVLSKGLKFETSEISSDPQGTQRFAQLIKEPDMTLAMIICNICLPDEMDAIVSILLNLFDSRAALVKLAKAMIEHEVACTEMQDELFLSDSICTSFLSAIAKFHGYSYLQTLINALIKSMELLPAGQGYELDPAKAGEQDIEQNRKNVEFVAHSFLESIASSVSALPSWVQNPSCSPAENDLLPCSMLREICAHIATTVYERWPEDKFTALGAFVFLRFISPAVMSPETIDLDPPSYILRCGLISVAKIIQKLANYAFTLEPHMMALNDFLRNHIVHVTDYLSELSRYTPGEDDEEWLGTASDDTDIVVLRRFFDRHADMIGKELLSISKLSGKRSDPVINGRRIWDNLCSLLVDLGPPLDVPKPSSLDLRDHREFQDLIRRYASKSTDSVRDIICETVPPSESDGTGYLVFRVSKVNAEALDVKLFMYHLFKTIRSSRYDGYDIEIILDCTDFTFMSEFPLSWMRFCAELVPADIRVKFSKIHILNPNTLAQRFLRRVYNICAGFGVLESPRVWQSITEMTSHIPTSVIESPALKYPLSLEQEQSDSFTDVMMKTQQMRTPVQLTIGVTHIRITSLRTFNIATGLACRSSEIILLADVNDVYNVQAGLETNEFVIRRNRLGDTIYFTSPHRGSIIRTIRVAKSRFKDQRMPAERFMRSSNVPATLLHIGMLSLDEYDEEVQAAAIDLLGAVCSYLDYDKSPLVAPEAGFVLGAIGAFVMNLSTHLAGLSPQLTLDFLLEAVAAINMNEMHKVRQAINCLRYMSPWIKNLQLFANPANPLFERTGAKLRDCIRALIEMSVNLNELAMNVVQTCVWSEVGRLTGNIVDIIFDELVRSAINGGVGTFQNEIIANCIASAASVAIRGRLFFRLRNAIVKTSPRLSRTPSQNSASTEISTLIRIALIAGTGMGHSTDNELHVPEIAHIVTLVAGVGSTFIRRSVYGIFTNLVQSLYLASVHKIPSPEISQLIQDMTEEEVLNLFGLSQQVVTNEYSSFDEEKDKLIIQNQEKLTAFLVRVMDDSAESENQLSVWKARWRYLATASAFQCTSMVQMRSFTALGVLSASDMGDDFMYQVLKAIQTALLRSEVTDTTALVAILRYITSVVPSLQADSRYITELFWLGVAFLQSSHIVFFEDAAALVSLTMKEMEKRRIFVGTTAPIRLLEARAPIEEPAQQLDHLSQLSCDSSLSFSLAALLFKGMRQSGLKDSAEEALRTLLRITTSVGAQTLVDKIHGYPSTVDPDALGYFLALVSMSTTTADFRNLLEDCGIKDDPSLEEEMATSPPYHYQALNVPSVSMELLGIVDADTALLAASFIGLMLMSAQRDDTESQMLYSILADIAIMFPETIQLVYESLQDRITDTFANSSNPTIIQYVSNIIRVALDGGGEMDWRNRMFRHSSAMLNAAEQTSLLPDSSRLYLKALNDQGMQGLAKNFQFLPAQSTATAKMLILVSNLVACMISE